MKKSRAPRTAPILWGTLFLIFSIWVADRTMLGSILAPEIWVTIVVLLLGFALLGAGAIAMFRSRESVTGQASEMPDSSNTESNSGS